MGTSLSARPWCKLILGLLEHIDRARVEVGVIPDAVHLLLFAQAGHEP
jgi:hypothetical protein